MPNLPRIKRLILQKKEALKVVGIASLFIGAFISFYIGFKTNPEKSSPKPSPKPSPTRSSTPEYSIPPQPTFKPASVKTTIKVSQNVVFEGHDISYSVTFPAEGGTVTIETGLGACYGSGTGTFEGNDSTAVSGSLSGTCDYYSDILNATGTFSGNIYIEEGEASGTWEGGTNGHSKSGTWSFTFDPVN